MGIEYVQGGDLLQADAKAYVNTVNCVGVMGKGLALQFKKKYPEYFRHYRKACEKKELRPGEVLVYDAGFTFDYQPRYIISFPTKDHWRGKSRLEWIESGLVSLAKKIKDLEIGSVAVPALGCSHGGLQWDDVRPLIEEKLGHLVIETEPGHLKEVRVLVYEPPTSRLASSTSPHGEADSQPSASS